MPSRRDMVRMSPEDIGDYLRGQRRITLVTIGRDHWPHAVPMNYGLDNDGDIVMTAFAKSQKVRNLERDPRATLLVDSGVRYGELQGVMMRCRVAIERDPDRIRAGMQAIRIPGDTERPLSEAQDAQVRQSMSKRVLLRCTPESFVSWDHARLGDRY